jgi:hypothetical protein
MRHTTVALLAALACTGSRAPGSRAIPVDPPLRIGGYVIEPASVLEYLARVQRRSASRGGRAECSYTPLAASRDTAYLWVLCMELVPEGDSLAVGTAGSLPMALAIDTTGPAPRFTAAWRPEDGQGYGRSIRARFPPAAARLALDLPVEDHNARVRALEAKLRARAAQRPVWLERASGMGSVRRDTIRRPSVPDVRPDTARAAWPATGVPVRCYRSPHSVLFGPRTKSGQQGRRPGWIRLEGSAAADSGSAELVDTDRKGVGGSWRASADSVLVVAASHDLRVDVRLAVSDSALGGRARAFSDQDLEPDVAGRLQYFQRDWLLRASRAPCDSMPVPWRYVPWR